MDEPNKVLALFEKLQATMTDAAERTIKAQAKTIEELELKIARYEKTIEIQHEQLEESQNALAERDGAIETFEKSLKEAEKEAETARREPIAKRILQFERMDPNSNEGKTRLAELMEENSKSLTRMLNLAERLVELQKKGLSGGSQASIIEDGIPVIHNSDQMSPDERVRRTIEQVRSNRGAREEGYFEGSAGGM